MISKMTRSAFYLIVPILFLSAAALSCSPSENNTPDSSVSPDTNPGDNPGDNPGEDPGSEITDNIYTFVASPLQEKWAAGDQIYVHGAIGSWCQVVTLEASDISEDGKMAKGKLGSDVMEKLADPDGLYAAWPDQAVKHLKSKIGSRTTFEACEGLLTAAYLEDKTFNFIDVSSGITFSVSGDYDRYALCSGYRVGLNVTSFDVDYTSAKTSLTLNSDGYPYKYGNVETGKNNRIWLPGGTTFKGGFTIFLGKGDNWTASYTEEKDITLAPGKMEELGDISSLAKPYEGMAPRMPVLTGSEKFTVKLAELSGLYLGEDESFLWGVGDEGDLGKISFKGEVLYSFHIGGDAEDVSLDSRTGDLLIGLEPQGVGLVKAPDFNTRVTTLFNIPACSGYGNSGIEGLTYYKDGMVFAGAQANSHLFLCDLDGKKVIHDWKMWKKELVSEIAGLCYDPLTDWLWIIDSENKMIYVFSAQKIYDTVESGEDIYSALLGAYPVGTPENPESVCVDHKNSCVWVGDDLGDSTSYLYKYSFTGLDDFNIAKK